MLVVAVLERKPPMPLHEWDVSAAAAAEKDPEGRSVASQAVATTGYPCRSGLTYPARGDQRTFKRNFVGIIPPGRKAEFALVAPFPPLVLFSPTGLLYELGNALSRGSYSILEFGGEVKLWRRNVRSRCASVTNQAVLSASLRNIRHKLSL